jgi:hypothetical protein
MRDAQSFSDLRASRVIRSVDISPTGLAAERVGKPAMTLTRSAFRACARTHPKMVLVPERAAARILESCGRSSTSAHQTIGRLLIRPLSHSWRIQIQGPHAGCGPDGISRCKRRLDLRQSVSSHFYTYRPAEQRGGKAITETSKHSFFRESDTPRPPLHDATGAAVAGEATTGRFGADENGSGGPMLHVRTC